MSWSWSGGFQRSARLLLVELSLLCLHGDVRDLRGSRSSNLESLGFRGGLVVQLCKETLHICAKSVVFPLDVELLHLAPQSGRAEAERRCGLLHALLGLQRSLDGLTFGFGDHVCELL